MGFFDFLFNTQSDTNTDNSNDPLKTEQKVPALQPGVFAGHDNGALR